MRCQTHSTRQSPSSTYWRFSLAAIRRFRTRKWMVSIVTFGYEGSGGNAYCCWPNGPAIQEKNDRDALFASVSTLRSMPPTREKRPADRSENPVQRRHILYGVKISNTPLHTTSHSVLTQLNCVSVVAKPKPVQPGSATKPTVQAPVHPRRMG